MSKNGLRLNLGLSAWMLWTGAGLGLAEAPPAKLASAARVDLNAEASVGALADAKFTFGSGRIERQTWLAESEWRRTYMIHVPIVRFSWSEFGVRFVPERDGAVTLSLRGPWEEVAPGSGRIFRQEVLWDLLSGSGTQLINGGFENSAGGSVVGWSGGTVELVTSPLAAIDGQRVARTWHDGSMNQTLQVRGGVPVELRFWALAPIPATFQDMKPIRDPDTPAHRTARKFMRGVNFGQNLELTPDNSGRLSYDATDFAQARAEGFDHVRIPIAWHHYTGPSPDYTLAPSILETVDAWIAHAFGQGLAVLIDVHNFDEFSVDPSAHTNELYAIWRQLGNHYAAAPPALAFEILNEPRDPVTTQTMNPIYAEAIRQIRISNPDRTLFIGMAAFNGISELNHLILPDDDHNLIATVHTYDPFLFTHQGQPWAGEDAAALSGIRFPGPPPTSLVPRGPLNLWAELWLADYNSLPSEQNPSSPAAFAGRFQFIRQWSDYYGRPVHVGEFGAFETIDPESRRNYYHAKREALDQAGIGWAIWDWKAGFHYWKNGAPDPPTLRTALFPAPELQVLGPGSFRVQGAIGKRFVVERAFRLAPSPDWTPIGERILDRPEWSFADPAAPAQGTAFYRVGWRK